MRVRGSNSIYESLAWLVYLCVSPYMRESSPNDAKSKVEVPIEEHTIATSSAVEETLLMVYSSAEGPTSRSRQNVTRKYQPVAFVNP